MKLDHECIRALLLVLEETLKFGEGLELPTVWFADLCMDLRLQVFTKDSLAYSTQKLEEAGFIQVNIEYAGDSFNDAEYISITFSGHEYLEGIRDSENWKKIKSISGKIGNASLSIITSISEGVATAALKKLLNTSE